MHRVPAADVPSCLSPLPIDCIVCEAAGFTPVGFPAAGRRGEPGRSPRPQRVGLAAQAISQSTASRQPGTAGSASASDPGRFEIRNGLVRARYGHSVALGSPGESRTPPEFLLHGTSADALATVLATGLRPMNRAFVHLTTKPEYAAQVVAAKGGGVVLSVRAKEAAVEGIEFFLTVPNYGDGLS